MEEIAERLEGLLNAYSNAPCSTCSQSMIRGFCGRCRCDFSFVEGLIDVLYRTKDV